MPVQQKPFYKRLLGLRLFFLANLVGLALLGLSFGREFVRNRDIQRDITQLQAQAASLEAERIRITDLNSALQTESAIEREARLKLGLKKPGEEVVVIQEGDVEVLQVVEDTEDAETGEHVPMVSTASSEPVANPSKWWYYFFDTHRFEQITRYGKS